MVQTKVLFFRDSQIDTSVRRQHYYDAVAQFPNIIFERGIFALPKSVGTQLKCLAQHSPNPNLPFGSSVTLIYCDSVAQRGEWVDYECESTGVASVS